MTNTTTKKHTGSCHCGAVKFEVELDASKGSRCNCTVCTKIAGVGAIVKPHELVVLTSDEHLSTYVCGPVATRYFCKHCGVHCFSRGHLPEVGGDYAGVYMNTLDDVDPATIALTYWDGRHNNWEAGPRATPYPIFRDAAAASA